MRNPFDVETEDPLRRLMVLMRRIGEQMRQAMVGVLDEHGLTKSQFLFLASVADPAPMGALADHLCLDASYVTGLVDHLEAEGLVVRQTDPADRRRTLIAVTDEGRALREKVHDALASQAPIATRLDSGEIGGLVALLEKAAGPEI